MSLLDAALANDPDLSFQAAAYWHGRTVLDVWGGPHLSEHSLSVPYSVTKNIIGVCIGLLVERDQLDLDSRVADHWPEFGRSGKADVTVRQLLSHQAGLPQATPPLTWAELLDDHRAAERLAASPPLWKPGSDFGYHVYTIGNLASELVFRITGRTLQEYYETEIRSRWAIDFHLGLLSESAARLAPTLPMIPSTGRRSSSSTTLLDQIRAAPGPSVDLANDEVSWRFGHPAASGAGTARGIAALLAAAVTGLADSQPFLSQETVGVIGQRQVHGFDVVLGGPERAHSIVFQKPTATYAFGGPNAFGHD